MSGAGEVVCEGWLRKSPPEKKLRRYAWKRRWFVLRSGRLSGEPDVLQYYKNQQSRRPIRTINLNMCEQVDAGLSFTKKELESSFVFDLRTEERTWYLVAESEEDMNRWVSSICLLCGFSPTDDGEEIPDTPTDPHMSHSFCCVAVEMCRCGKVHVMTSTGACATISTVTGSVPPPYDPVSVADRAVQGPDENYVPMTPLSSSLPTQQVPPPVHMGFRSSPRFNPMSPPGEGEGGADSTPPPIHRNLKPQPRVKPAPLDITPVPQDWQEVPPPVRSPVTRTFTRELMLHRASEGGVSSPLLWRGKGVKQVEYLDLDLHTRRSTSVRKERTRGERARVDYVVVDPKRTKALRNTREAWHDGRMSTEKEK
uniref:PH domain-containing protein n=1 Tax=Sphaeramia orbicularis TaxID=375764 RepID=A0A673BB58_9TELE